MTRRGLVSRLAFLPLLLIASCTPPQVVEPPPADSALRDTLPALVQERGVLRIGTDASYAPLSMFAPDGRTVIGFEADLARRLGQVLGVEVEFVVTDFGALLPDLNAGRIDLVVAAMTDTPERERRADFINYFVAGTSIVVQRGNPHGISRLADLCGEKVAVERGTVQVDLLRRSQDRCHGDRIQVDQEPTNDDALLELRTGRAAAVLNDYPPAVYLTSDPQTRGEFQLASETQYQPGPYGIGVRRDQPGLRRAVRVALEQVLTDGTYDQMLAYWGVDSGAIGQVSVNAG